MLIFRVEHPESGQGPYNSDPWPHQEAMVWEHGSYSSVGILRHPAPHMDPVLSEVMLSYGHKCACDSPESLLAWFAGWWDELEEAGFVVTIRRARFAWVGDYGQVVYNSSYAPELDRLDVDTFVELFRAPA